MMQATTGMIHRFQLQFVRIGAEMAPCHPKIERQELVTPRSRMSHHSRDNNVKETKDKTYAGGVMDLFSERSSPPGSPVVRRDLSLFQRSREDNNARVRIEEDHRHGSMEDKSTRVQIK